MIKRLLVFCLLFWPMMAVADEATTILEVQGFGGTRSEAVQNGLIEALQQARGVNIDSQKVFIKNIREKGLATDAASSHSVAIDEQSQSAVREATDGFIKEYRVTGARDTGSDGWVADLVVVLGQYKTPGLSPHNRRKIAVIPFKTKQAYYILNGVRTSAREVSLQFAQKMVTELTQSRKFTVLDREYTDEFLREKNLILSSDAPPDELMKIGEALGVDYLLVGTITEAAQKRIPYSIQVTGETGYTHSASFAADYRIVVMATRQIKWADSASITLGDAALKRMVSGLDTAQIQQTLLASAAQSVVHRALENIYPLRVAKVQSGGEVILNQGGVTLSKGDRLDVFNAGDDVIDPYTGESLGAEESWVATIEIVRVIPKMSYAKVVNGAASSIRDGSICRRDGKKQTARRQSTGKAADVKTAPGGGVRLPFDN